MTKSLWKSCADQVYFSYKTMQAVENTKNRVLNNILVELRELKFSKLKEICSVLYCNCQPHLRKSSDNFSSGLFEFP